MAASSMAANSSSHSNQNWFTDTSASNHITPDLAQLSLHEQPTAGETVTVGNGQELPITHIGNGKLLTPFHNFNLNNILKVPQIASNLLSMHKLCLQNNAFCYFDAHEFSIQDLPTGKYKGLSKNGVYPIPPIASFSSSPTSSINSSCFVAVSTQVLLWHQRPRHPCSKILHSALSDVPSVNISPSSDILSQCVSCISAKMHKSSFPKHVSSTTFPLELVHSDVWGPTPIVSVLEHRFYVIFVDDFTCFTWLFLLKHISNTFSVFVHFKSLVENQFNTKIKALRSNGGGEFVNHNLRPFV